MGCGVSVVRAVALDDVRVSAVVPRRVGAYAVITAPISVSCVISAVLDAESCAAK